MPGIKKNENANNPHANKYKVPGVSKSIASPFRKNPIPIPRNAKKSNIKLFVFSKRSNFN